MPSGGDYVRASDTTAYFVKGTQSSAQSIPNNAFTAITFNGTDDVDNLGVHDPVTNNSQFNLGLKLGWWLIGGTYATSASGTTPFSLRCRFIVNGTTGVNGGYTVPSAIYTPSTGTITESGFYSIGNSTIVQTTASADYVEFQGLQASGGAINTTVSGDLRSQFWGVFLAAS